MSAIVETAELGRRIRKLRLERRMTLKQVEEASSLSATHLSEIERGRTSPTIGALVRIARSLGREASYFIEPEERDEVAYLQREHTRPLKVAKGVTVESLTTGIPGSRLFAYRVRLDPGAEFHLAAQPGEDDAFYYMRRGTAEASFGDHSATLGEGDVAQATLHMPHTIRSPRDEPVELVAVITYPLEDLP